MFSAIKKPAFVATVACLLSAFRTQSVSASLIDFDSFTPGTLVTTPISGVTFSISVGGEFPSIFDPVPFSGITSTPPNALLNAEDFSFSEPDGDLSMLFGTPVNDLSFTYGFENGDLTFTVFQGAVSTPVVVAFDSDPLDVDTIDLSTFSGVTSVTISSAFPDDYYFIDTISFETDTAIPEPSSLALLGLGSLTLLGYGSRRRRGLEVSA